MALCLQFPYTRGHERSRIYSGNHAQTRQSLTHWCRDKMAAILRTTYSNAFSWAKMYEFWLKSHWTLFLSVQLTIFQHWFRKWLGACQATSHYLNQWWLAYWRIYVSLGLNELKVGPDRVLPMFRGHFSPNNPRNTLIARPLGRVMGVFREFEVWPDLYLQCCWFMCNIVLYCTGIYQESILNGIIQLCLSTSMTARTNQ